MSSIKIERQGQRVYFMGDTFRAKDRIKSMGGHWDGDRRAWWVGAKKLSEAESLVAELNGGAPKAAASVGLRQDTPAGIVADKLDDEGRETEAAAIRTAATQPKTEDLDGCRVYAQVEYKGKRYYVIAEQRGSDGLPIRVRLTTLDGLTPFWVDAPACNLIRTYQGREQWDGRYNSGRNITVYQTIGSMRRFRDKQQRLAAAGEEACASCGKRGSLVHDLEDGCMKCRGCADIPE